MSASGVRAVNRPMSLGRSGSMDPFPAHTSPTSIESGFTVLPCIGPGYTATLTYHHGNVKDDLTPGVAMASLHKRHTWHDELTRSRPSSADTTSDVNNTVESSKPSKARKEKRKKRKKKIKSGSKLRTKVRSSSVTLVSRHVDTNANNHGNGQSFLISKCATTIKVHPSPPRVSPPRLVARLMGGAASNGNSRESTSVSVVAMTPAIQPRAAVHSSTPSSAVLHTRVTKVYCSDKQSGIIRLQGVELPCAPPTTPTPVMLERYEYIPSLADIRSQRAVKVRLDALDKLARKKLEKLKKDKQEQDKVEKKIKDKDLKHRQRQEIYALNKLMTEFENANFIDFCQKNGVEYKTNS